MYENDNFSGYETGNENTTGTFSGVSAAGSANGYTTYQMGGSTGSNTEPKNSKKHGGYFRKAMVSVSLGLFFGLFAGIGFYAVQQGTGMLKTGTDTAVVGEVASEAATESSQSTPQLATNVTYVESDVSDVVEKVMPAMVSIVNNFTETANVFGQQYTQEEAASGSGIIVGKTDDELLIVSNNHVVESADTLTVTFIDGSEAQAQVKGLDSDMDLAVIAVSLNDLSDDTKNAITVATLGSSDDLKLGEPVIAIGNALGYGQSVTNGIVSALNREITLENGSTGLENGSTGTFIQTNAAINPGNSGGALLNMNGEVIGINSNKIGGTAVEGMGYAIPITSASPIIADLMERQTRTKVAEDEVGYIGISLQEVTSQISQMYNMPEGIYVVSVEEGSAAANAGIMKGDIITKFDGSSISSYSDLQKTLQYYAAGDSATITEQRPQNGEYVSVELNLTLGSRPADKK
ncbi:MAG: trypsin-like peptidase domain-containing protein [Acetatifactor sp.]|nr:trypsin-like peptidase domain-containing protein [Acetatifactor sp.]